MTKERYTDVYGCVGIITRTKTDRTKLSIRTPYGDTVVKKWYNSYRGAKIAMGLYGEGMWTRDDR